VSHAVASCACKMPLFWRPNKWKPVEQRVKTICSELRDITNNVNCLWQNNQWRKVYLSTSHTVLRLVLLCVHSILPMKEQQLYKTNELKDWPLSEHMWLCGLWKVSLDSKHRCGIIFRPTELNKPLPLDLQ
jgi:hypothetical protein